MIGGLESVYTHSAARTLQVVLKALNNRKHIYVVNLSDSYAALKARERAQRETEGKYAQLTHIHRFLYGVHRGQNWPKLSNQYFFHDSVLYVSVCVPQRLCRKRKLTGRSSGCSSWMRRSMMLCLRRRRSELSSDIERSSDKRNSGTGWKTGRHEHPYQIQVRFTKLS